MDMESRERMKARNVHGRRLNVSGKDVIKASQSLGKVERGVTDMYLRLMKSLGFRESVFYFEGKDVTFKMSVSEEDYLDQLTSVINILNFGKCLSLKVVTHVAIHEMESDGDVIDEVKCIDLLYHTKEHGLFENEHGDLIEDYIDTLENKHMFSNPPKWLV